MLKVGGFKPIYPRTAGIDWLGYDGPRKRLTGRRRIALVGHDGIGQIFVEIADGDDSEGVQVMLEQHIHVVCRLWL